MPKKSAAKKPNLTTSIINKWNEQGSFIRFLDGDKGNCAVTNLSRVTIQQAMNHIDDWVVDWDIELTDEERNLVLTAKWREGLSFGSK